MYIYNVYIYNGQQSIKMCDRWKPNEMYTTYIL